MQQVRLEVEPRNNKGKGVARELRRLGIIPGVVYGHKFEPVPIQVSKRRIQTLMEAGSGGENVLIDLAIGDKGSELAMLKEVQRHPITRNILHVDFMRVSLEETVTTHVRIMLLGTPIGVSQQGGVMEFPRREVEIECLPTRIPEQMKIEVSQLSIGDSVRIGDLQIPEGIKVLDDPDTIIVTIGAPAALKEEEVKPAVEEAAEPEVIGAKREEEEEEETGKEGH